MILILYINIFVNIKIIKNIQEVYYNDNTNTQLKKGEILKHFPQDIKIILEIKEGEIFFLFEEKLYFKTTNRTSHFYSHV